MENYIAELYKSGLTIRSISNTIKMSYNRVRDVIKRLGIIRCQRKHFFNQNYFECLDNPEVCYWLGFIYADGSIAGKDGLRIDLQDIDRYHLEKFINHIGLSNDSVLTTRIIKERKYACLRLNSVIMRRQLQYAGISPDKTKNPMLPKIPDELFVHFLRGFFDGDGTLYYELDQKIKNVAFRLLVHDNNIDWFLQKLKMLFPITEFSIKKHHSTAYIKSLEISGYSNILPVLDLLYKDNELFLHRKYEKYQNIKKYMQENCNNPQKIANRTTKYKGVTKSGNKYSAMIKHKNQAIYLGVYDSEEEAALAFNKKAVELRGYKAILNHIESSPLSSSS